MLSWSRRAIFASACLSLVACSSGDAPPPEEAPRAAEKYLGLEVPAPGTGLQVRNRGAIIAPGEDVEYCEVAELPGDVDAVYTVGSLELANSLYSHHLIVEAANPGTRAEAALAQLEVGARVPCLNPSAEFGEGFQPLGGAQATYKKYSYAEGVGRRLHGGQRLVFDYHYFNTSTDEIEARSALNLHFVPAEDVEHLAQIFTFRNLTIDVPVGARASFAGECRFTEDMRVMELTRHTHRWGREFEAFFLGGARDGEHIFTSPGYEEGVDHVFDPPILVKVAEGFRFRCDFENTESYPLRWGTNATDEMCNLSGLLFSETTNEPPSQDCVLAKVEGDGIARPRTDVSFPVPTEAEVSACLEGAAGNVDAVSSPACVQCSCSNCAAVIDTCANDEHCRVILGCVTRTGCVGIDCFEACQTELDEHSAGTGLLGQVGECIGSYCPACG